MTARRRSFLSTNDLFIINMSYWSTYAYETVAQQCKSGFNFWGGQKPCSYFCLFLHSMYACYASSLLRLTTSRIYQSVLQTSRDLMNIIRAYARREVPWNKMSKETVQSSATPTLMSTPKCSFESFLLFCLRKFASPCCLISQAASCLRHLPFEEGSKVLIRLACRRSSGGWLHHQWIR